MTVVEQVEPMDETTTTVCPARSETAVYMSLTMILDLHPASRKQDGQPLVKPSAWLQECPVARWISQWICLVLMYREGEW